MHRPILRFLLVPDASAARRVRRQLAQDRAQLGVIVGTWPELLARAQRAYLLPRMPGAPEENRQALRAALGEADEAFWLASLEAAPDETARAVEAALIELLAASDPQAGLDASRLRDLPDRPRQVTMDLVRLAEALGERLPGDLAAIRSLLRSSSDAAVTAIQVHRIEGLPHATRWQAALIDKLNRDAASIGSGPEDPSLAKALSDALARPAPPQAGTAFGALQAGLFSRSSESGRHALDGSLQWIGVRDFYQEAEIAAGMAQRLLAEMPGLESAEIGLLLPDSFEYAVAAEDAFRRAGLALSGLPGERWKRDLGAEAVFHFLFCRQKPAPAMALAVCLSSPLMPWTAEDGAVLAQAVMDGDYELRPPHRARWEARAMLDLLRGGDTEPATLARALPEFAESLNDGEPFAGHVQRACDIAGRVAAALKEAQEIDWPALRRIATPALITGNGETDFNLEGITVWREGHEPWRTVRYLIVLGFAQGRYPPGLRPSAVFAPGDRRAIRDALGLELELPEERQDRQRRRFLRQLRAAAESATFLVPRLDFAGRPQLPADSLTFMSQLFGGSESDTELVAELDSEADRGRIRHLATAASAAPQPARDLHRSDLRFDRDLLALRKDAEGRVKPQSPSSLELPMVSPLAWLLRQVAAEPLLWEPETADIRTVGTLAHKLFEELFRPGAPLPDRGALRSRVGRLLDDAVMHLAPYLRSAQWQVERRHLAEQAARAAEVWLNVLECLDAEILASEQWLEGIWSGIGVHGQTDLVLGLPGNRLLVVDYKWSKSQGRTARMEKGFDSQASLYRAMLESGGPKERRNPTADELERDRALAERLRKAAWIGIVYFTMRDGACLADAEAPGLEAVPSWIGFGNDVAGRAMDLIRKRLAELREGVVRLNRVGDAEFFEKEAGVKPYALEASPLIGLFTIPETRRD